jgi:Zn-dependent protease
MSSGRYKCERTFGDAPGASRLSAIVIRSPGAITVAHVQAIEIRVNWRWAPILVLGTWLLAQNVLPARFPAWELSTTWITSIAAVLAGEAALLLHELSHALVARRHGQHVSRIVFHGFLAETLVGDGLPTPSQVALIALVGPATNLVLAGLAELLRLTLASQGPLDAFLLMTILGNAATAAMSLVPLSESDGARALRALKAQVAREGENKHDEDDQP